MLRMLGVSALVLFFEMLLIRWVSTEINIFAYLQNAVLVICLFAIGVGCLKPARTIPLYRPFTLFSLLVLMQALPFTRPALQSISGCLALLHDFVVWQQWPIEDTSTRAIFVLIGGIITVTISILIFDMMSPLGQLLGGAFNSPSKPLKLYSANVLGSLLGILIFQASAQAQCGGSSRWPS